MPRRADGGRVQRPSSFDVDSAAGARRLWLISTSYPAHPAESINAGVLARDLALWFRDRGHAVTVVTPQKPDGLRLDDGLDALPLAWFRPTKAMADLRPRRPLDLVRIASLMTLARSRLLAAAKRARPDGIVALWALPSGIFARWLRRRHGTPYAVWLLGSDVWKADRFPGGVRALRRVLAEASGRFADGSELAGRAEALTGIGVEFLPSARRLPPPSGEAAPCDVLFVGRYHPNKGPDVLLEAFARVLAARPGATLRMHGGGELEATLRARGERLGLGSRFLLGPPLGAAELAAALRATKVLAVPSRIESIPLILGDAFQAGARVVVTDVGDMARVVRGSGRGEVVPPRDPEALAAALLRALDGTPPAAASGDSTPLSLEAAAARLLASLGPAVSRR